MARHDHARAVVLRVDDDGAEHGEELVGRGSVDPAVFLRQLHESVRDVPVDIHVTFKPVALTSAEVVDLEVGDVVPLHHSVNEPLTISVGNVGCFAGVSGRKGKRLACLVVSALQEPDE